MVRNAANNLQTGAQTYYDQANSAGRDFGTNGGDINDALNYAHANQSLHQFADPVIGADRAGEFMKDFNTNYVKSFVAGVAENNPQQAAALLQEPAIAQHFTTQDIGDMGQLIEKTQKQQKLIQSIQTTKNDGALTDIVNDPNTSFYEKRVAIDKMDMEGTVSSKAASSARRVLTSQNDLDSQTDTPAMADVINKIYDLNANASSKPDDYLTGVRAVQNQVLELQANNQLTAKDAGNLNKEITNLTSSKLASATNTAGNEFYDANQSFNVLPPEYRGQATRALFYATNGQNMTPEQIKTQAGGVIDQINAQRRTQALTTVSRIGSDDTLLKATGYSRSDVAETAQKYGISPDEVIQNLRAKYAARPGSAPVNKARAMSNPENSDGISISGPSPKSGPTININEDEHDSESEQ